MTTDGSKPSWWKRAVLRAAVGGAAGGLVLALALTGLYVYISRPKPWNTTALRSIHAKANPISRLDQKFNELSSGVDFTVDVENTTGEDFTMSKSVNIMQQNRASHALHGSFLKLSDDYALPAKHTVTLYLGSDDRCAANYDAKSCFDSYFGEDDDIVIFDEVKKYELHVPIPALTLPKDGTKYMKQE